jgi:hypothetical protein
MKGLKKIFEGDRVVVYKAQSDEFVSDAIKSGFFTQKDGKLIDKSGKEVIITKSGFFHYPRLTGNCGGSVFGIYGSSVWTNWHVADCADVLDMGTKQYVVDWKAMLKPRTMPLWLIELLSKFGVDVSSKYDFAMGLIAGSEYYIPYSGYALILTAGNCSSQDDLNCLNIALEVPNLEPIPVGVTVEVVCNYWGYVAIEEIIDKGSALVNYGGNYAVLNPAYLLKPISKSAIPGCSGSAVTPLRHTGVTEAS